MTSISIRKTTKKNKFSSIKLCNKYAQIKYSSLPIV